MYKQTLLCYQGGMLWLKDNATKQNYQNQNNLQRRDGIEKGSVLLSLYTFVYQTFYTGMHFAFIVIKLPLTVIKVE